MEAAGAVELNAEALAMTELLPPAPDTPTLRLATGLGAAVEVATALVGGEPISAGRG